MPPHKWTAEEKAAASERARARIAREAEAEKEWLPEFQAEVRAERSAKEHAEYDAKHPPEPSSEPASDGVLAQLAGLFQAASGQKQGRDKAITEALDLLGKLDPGKYPDIADNPTVQAFVEKVQMQRAQSSDVPPGTIMGSGLAAIKKPWTKNDLLKGKGMPPAEAIARGYIEWVEYRPMRNMDVTWQGIRIVWPARRLGYFPKSHVDVFEQSIDAEHWNEQHAAWLFNNPDAEIHADYFTTNGPRLKAMDASKGEYYQPGGGMISMAASPDLVGDGEQEGAA